MKVLQLTPKRERQPPLDLATPVHTPAPPSQVLVRKQHNSGLKHKANVRSYYKEFHQALNDPLQGNLRAKEELQRQIAANFNAAMMSGPGPARGGGPPRGMYMPPGGR